MSNTLQTAAAKSDEVMKHAEFINRLRAEKVGLDDRIVKLTKLIASDRVWIDITTHDRDLLFKQQYVMLQYSLVLGERLVSLGEF